MRAKFNANVYVIYSLADKFFSAKVKIEPLFFTIKKCGKRLYFPQHNQLQKHFFQKLRNLFCVLPINK